MLSVYQYKRNNKIEYSGGSSQTGRLKQNEYTSAERFFSEFQCKQFE